jgi:hypothetical protein
MTKKAQLSHLERTKIVHLITNLLPSYMWNGKQSGTDFESNFISHNKSCKFGHYLSRVWGLDRIAFGGVKELEEIYAE